MTPLPAGGEDGPGPLQPGLSLPISKPEAVKNKGPKTPAPGRSAGKGWVCSRGWAAE